MIANEVITINILANCPVSANSMGGGDRIFIELTRGWSKQGFNCTLLGCEEAMGMCVKNNLNVNRQIISKYPAERWGIMGAYIARIINSFFKNLPIHKDGKTIIYSASDFLPDIVPVWKLKIKNRKIKWIVGLYLRIPNPFKRECLFNINSLLSYVGQHLSIKLMKKYVDLVFVLSIDDIDYLVTKGIEKRKIIVISGGVDFNIIENIKAEKKLYDACFVGRFHPQKGLLNLIESWKLVVEKKRESSLIIIGWGDKSIQSAVFEKIKLYNLENNIKLMGFCDGDKKYRLVKASKVLLFPSNHESWGIVVLEAMACGVPVIAYELPVLKRNFSKGIKFVVLGDYKGFADAVISLLNDNKEYKILQQEGIKIAKKYDWGELVKSVGEQIKLL